MGAPAGLCRLCPRPVGPLLSGANPLPHQRQRLHRQGPGLRAHPSGPGAQPRRHRRPRISAPRLPIPPVQAGDWRFPERLHHPGAGCGGQGAVAEPGGQGQRRGPEGGLSPAFPFQPGVPPLRGAQPPRIPAPGGQGLRPGQDAGALCFAPRLFCIRKTACRWNTPCPRRRFRPRRRRNRAADARTAPRR